MEKQKRLRMNRLEQANVRMERYKKTRADVFLDNIFCELCRQPINTRSLAKRFCSGECQYKNKQNENNPRKAEYI